MDLLRQKVESDSLPAIHGHYKSTSFDDQIRVARDENVHVVNGSRLSFGYQQESKTPK